MIKQEDASQYDEIAWEYDTQFKKIKMWEKRIFSNNYMVKVQKDKEKENTILMYQAIVQ